MATINRQTLSESNEWDCVSKGFDSFEIANNKISDISQKIVSGTNGKFYICSKNSVIRSLFGNLSR